MYNFTLIDTSNGVPELFINFNTILSGKLAIGILVVLFVALILIFKDRYDLKVILFADSLVISILTGLLFVGGYIAKEILMIPIAILVGSILIIGFE